MIRLLIPIVALTLASASLAQDKSQPAPPKAEPAKQPEAMPAPKQEDKLVYVKMNTSAGDIVLELNETKAPISVKNFLSYADKDFYKGTIFHRVMKDFMIQGGGHDTAWNLKKTDAQIKNEWRNGLKNVKYSIAMARIGGNADSASSQFFINVKDNGMLDMPQGDGAAYAVFGRVVDGFDTVEKIRTSKVGPDMRGEVSKPAEPAVINSVKRLSDEEVAAWKNKGGKPAEKPAPAAEPKKEEPKKEGK